MTGNWRIFPIVAACAAILFGCSSKERDIVVAEVGTSHVKIDEYEKFFSRNSGGWDVARASTQPERERFLDLLTNYRLKLQDAYDRKLQEDPELKAELADYRASLASTYLVDHEITDPGVKELYGRRKEEIRASHVLIALKHDATPAETLTAYNHALDILKKAVEGEPFDSLAKKYSDDPSAKNNYGDIYYFTGGQMTPLFENAAFALKVGEIAAKPVRTPFGYHVIKLTYRGPSKGTMKVRHIMTRFVTPADSDTVAPYRKISAILDTLRKGANFIQTAQRSSDDGGSASSGGDLGWFERRRWVQPFDDAAFHLSPGQISGIVRTPYGYHIIHCDSTKPLQPFDSLKEDLKKTYMQYRYNDDFAAYVGGMKKQYNYVFHTDVFDSLVGRLDSNKVIEDSGWTDAIPASMKKAALYTVNGKTVSVDSAIGVLIRRPEYKNTSLHKSELENRFDRIGDGILFNERAIGLEQRYPEFAATMTEYEDGIVLFKAEQMEVWNRVSVSDSALHAYWEDNKEKFKTIPRVNFAELHVAMDTTALALYDSLSRGADFSDIVDRHGIDASVKETHGVHGFVPITTDELSKLADSLAIGEISDPIAIESGGMSIIKVIAKEPARVKTFDEAGAEVSNALQESESKRLEKAWLDRLQARWPVIQYKDRLVQAFPESSKQSN